MKKICVFILLTLLCPLLLAAKDTAICSFVAESNCEYHVYMPKPWDEGFNFTDKSMDGYDYGLWILNRDKVHDMTLYMKHDVPAPPGYCLIKKICWGEITAKLIPIGIRHY